MAFRFWDKTRPMKVCLKTSTAIVCTRGRRRARGKQAQTTVQKWALQSFKNNGTEPPSGQTGKHVDGWKDMQCELDMNLLCWGSGELGQSGHGRPGEINPEEAHLREFTKAWLGRVKLLACGSSHSIVVTVDNKIFAWGNGTSGQLGDGERTVKYQPVEVKLPQELTNEGSDTNLDVVNIVGVACGSRHSFIWTETGQAYSFGNNFYAQLGYDFQRLDFKEPQLAPRLFQNLPSSLKISQVACGERHTLFALEDGSVAACGHNDYGQIGSGSDETVVVPRFVERVDHVSKVTCGANHNLALTDFLFHQTHQHKSAGRYLKEMELTSLLMSCHRVLQSSPTLLNFMRISEPSSPRSAHHLRERQGGRETELARIWPWLLIHNSHCLLHTFQNSFRL
ncbi:hypothetical protein ABVT39_015765 [Epinephelus coioides]